MLAGLIYARHPGWSYGSAFATVALGQSAVMQWRGTLPAITLFAGAIGGAWLAGRFRFQGLTLWRALRCAVGGLVMGFGAALVPGGNDTLLLWAIPGLTIYGALAYVLMLGTVALGFLLSTRRGSKPSLTR